MNLERDKHRKLFLGTRELVQDDGIQAISFQIMILDIIKNNSPIHPKFPASVCQQLYGIYQRQGLASWEAGSKETLMRHAEGELCSRPGMSQWGLEHSSGSSPPFSLCDWAPEFGETQTLLVRQYSGFWFEELLQSIGCVPQAHRPESECLNLHKNNWMQYLVSIILAILSWVGRQRQGTT